MNIRLSLILIIILCACDNRSTQNHYLVENNHSNKSLKIELIDSIIIKKEATGIKEYFPLSLSPSKNKMLVLDSRGKSEVFIIDLLSKKSRQIDVEKYINTNDLGFNNIGFVSDSILSIFKSDNLFLFDFKNDKLISKKKLPSGIFSSYNKNTEIIVTESDTIYIANYHSKKGSDFLNESDGIYDKSVLSLYSSRNNSYKNILLPRISYFKEKNLGVPIVNFVRNHDYIFFSVSPENKFYKFNVDQIKFKVKDLDVYEFSYTYSDSLLSFEKSNYIKDIYKLSMLNPLQEDLVLLDNYLLLSVVKGLNEDDYMSLLTNKGSEKDKLENFTKKRKSYVEIINIKEKEHQGYFELDENVFSISLKLTDSTFVLKPKPSFYHADNKIPLYIVKIKIND